jgi:endo-beta-N-acetylglucosaminidase D
MIRYLKFISREEMLEALSKCGFALNGEISNASHVHTLIELGKIHGVEGWHINLKTDGSVDLTALDEYSVIPKNPRAVWA